MSSNGAPCHDREAPGEGRRWRGNDTCRSQVIGAGCPRVNVARARDVVGPGAEHPRLRADRPLTEATAAFTIWHSAVTMPFELSAGRWPARCGMPPPSRAAPSGRPSHCRRGRRARCGSRRSRSRVGQARIQPGRARRRASMPRRGFRPKFRAAAAISSLAGWSCSGAGPGARAMSACAGHAMFRGPFRHRVIAKGMNEIRMVPRGGIEPPTLRFSVACSTN